MKTRQSLKSIKLAVYAALGVSTTKQVKRQFKGYDLRTRAGWLAILAQCAPAAKRPAAQRPATVPIAELNAIIGYAKQLQSVGVETELAIAAARHLAQGRTAANSIYIRAAYLSVGYKGA